MREIEVRLPAHSWATRFEQAIEEVCPVHGQVVSPATTLARYPGSVHWHLKRRSQSGTLEVTMWEGECRLWLAIHDNRAAPWIDGIARGLLDALENRLREATGVT